MSSGAFDWGLSMICDGVVWWFFLVQKFVGASFGPAVWVSGMDWAMRFKLRSKFCVDRSIVFVLFFAIYNGPNGAYA